MIASMMNSGIAGKGKTPTEGAMSPSKKPTLWRSDAMDASSPSLASPATSHLKPQGQALVLLVSL